MSASIEFLDPVLRAVYLQVKAAYEARYPNREMPLTHTRRTPVEQLYLFVQGRLPNYPGDVVTWKDGFVNKSKHNFDPSRAFDFGVKINGKFEWDDYMFPHLKQVIPEILTELNLWEKVRYGGEFGDVWHIELR